MTTKFTPGPWIYDAGKEYVLEASPNSDGKRWYIACPIGIPYEHGGEDATLANANLIAAAPEMYEAIWLLVQEINFLERTGGMCVPSLGAMDRLEKALAKADGGAA